MVAKKRKSSSAKGKARQSPRSKPSTARQAEKNIRGKKAVAEALEAEQEVTAENANGEMEDRNAEDGEEAVGNIEVHPENNSAEEERSEADSELGLDEQASIVDSESSSSFSQELLPDGESDINGSTNFTNPEAKKRSLKQFEIMERRKRVAVLYSQGKAQWAIARIVGVNLGVVVADLKKIRELWRASAIIDYDERKAQELAKIDHLEEVSWEAWDKSCLDFHITTRKQEFARPAGNRNGKSDPDNPKPTMKLVEVRSSIVKVTEGQTGDPRFLDRIAWCIETRMKLFGLLDQSPHNVNQFTVHWDSLFTRPTINDPIESRIKAVETLASLPVSSPLLSHQPTPEEQALKEQSLKEQEEKVAETEADVRESLN